MKLPNTDLLSLENTTLHLHRRSQRDVGTAQGKRVLHQHLSYNNRGPQECKSIEQFEYWVLSKSIEFQFSAHSKKSEVFTFVSEPE